MDNLFEHWKEQIIFLDGISLVGPNFTVVIDGDFSIEVSCNSNNEITQITTRTPKTYNWNSRIMMYLTSGKSHYQIPREYKKDLQLFKEKLEKITKITNISIEVGGKPNVKTILDILVKDERKEEA